ncbi:hypothetical protein CLAFUW4_09682 [Fulvia fulva]|uniref:Uncharacterized protein n=1 Tax=Passalora fulva TaxID=5499 RepID=A0A9Q8PGL1_PASFU|nr:uncharacterized protein CLAFUR5_09776 [Fulvia fulva]KAK4614208.1 hypothetical protein CLAFUR4_09687 [Fulvia fulva]KAK4615141.1 hypothetical protein CLAFUR0_09678 [Fulvia fulva]UJO22098.1 hypothetical protein CLAFUR5_09776 [Fulvia fulva]WPV20621.1 hypothetical protein CLAFUW4_09682 [Fulvia fulva]WPV34875.1 hypothetical protein CLAFUW7_09683 [Fulvia fulva]
MSPAHTKKAGDGAQNVKTSSKDATPNGPPSETKSRDDSAKDVKKPQNPKNINYYHGLKVEEPEHEPESESEPEPEPVGKPNPTTAAVVDPNILTKAKKRRIRRARVAERDAGSGDGEAGGANPVASDTSDEEQKTEQAEIKLQTHRLKSENTASPGSYESSDDDVSDLEPDLEDDKEKTATETKEPEVHSPPENKDDDKILNHAIKKNKIIKANAKASASQITDDFVLFGGYACLILAVIAQYGLESLSLAQMLLLVGTVGVCVPLEWFGELVQVRKVEVERQGVKGGSHEDAGVAGDGEKVEIPGEMDSEKLEKVLDKVRTLVKTHGIGYGWLGVIMAGLVMRIMDMKSSPALAGLAFSVGCMAYLSGRDLAA